MSISSTSAQATDHAIARARILIGELVALLGLEQLGIADAADATPRIEDDRGGDDRSGQRPAPGLIDAGAQAVAQPD